MLKQSDIFKATISKILNLDSEARIYYTETIEGYNRPCYFIDVLPIKKEQQMYGLWEVQLLLVISYFSDDSKRIEVLDLLEDLSKSFKGLFVVSDRTLNIKEYQIESTGKREYSLILNISYIDAEEEKEECEIAQEIQVNIKK